MKIDRSGIVLYTIKYQDCVDFYQNVLGLHKLFDNETLTCFEFGGSYLMVEIDDEYFKQNSRSGRIRTCLRMNVDDVKKYTDLLDAKGIEVDYQEHDWGTVAKFFDPDGNLCALKDKQSFDKQISEYLN